MRRILGSAALALAFLAGAPLVFAQRTTGTITGTVKDSSGAVLPGATVAISGANVVGSQSSTTNEQGFYRIPNVPPGEYALSFTMNGFKTVTRRGLRVSLGVTNEENVSLEVSQLQEAIDVVAETSVVDTSSNEVGTNFGRDWVENAPIARNSFFDLVAQAREEIFLECPYVTDPFLRELQRAARRGVLVRIVTPETNNFPLVRQALAQAAVRSPLELRLYPGRMTHLKALLVDDHSLILGSANFDVWSDRSQQEYVSVVTEPGMVADFERRVVEPDLACSRPCPRPDAAEDARGVEARVAGLALLASLGARARGGP